MVGYNIYTEEEGKLVEAMQITEVCKAMHSVALV